MNAKQVIKILKMNGWKLDRINGSHHIFKKESELRSITVPVHGSTDIGNFAKEILKQAGIII